MCIDRVYRKSFFSGGGSMDNSVISLNDIVKAVEPLREKYKIDAVYVFGSQNSSI